ncbi:hypothetical protein BC937DRAFT_95476 [Endogone sp. FLAS-F59071]|nr:hypothetical protein BC937DRAFT_95476 [Endogone sp. FLAS-F59071]|eukprot:RUS20324.1 hypothetical protein BC937DRAFT_95476 [Endogone sp. FLAS-F59071]
MSSSTFTSLQPVRKKISRIRWANQQNVADVDLYLATGTWDEGKGLLQQQENVVTLWKYHVPKLADCIAAATDLSPAKETSLQHRAVALVQIGHEGDVMDMEFFDGDMLFTASSRGFLNIYKVEQNKGDPMITEGQHRQLHRFSEFSYAPCTGLSIRPNNPTDPEVASVGEDGKLVVLRVESGSTDAIALGENLGECFDLNRAENRHHIMLLGLKAPKHANIAQFDSNS